MAALGLIMHYNNNSNNNNKSFIYTGDIYPHYTTLVCGMRSESSEVLNLNLLSRPLRRCCRTRKCLMKTFYFLA